MRLSNFLVSCDDKIQNLGALYNNPSWVMSRDATSKAYEIAVEIYE